MPLSCLDDGATRYAFSVADWPALIADNRARRHLRMACCPAQVALKTSALGTRFFAHVARGGCATGDESREHLWLKQCAVDAARARGWQAETEVAGAGWRADVLATRGSRKVAIEIQWSAQDDAETLRRQAQYDAAGVRALWLFRQRGFPASAAVPAVRVTGSFAAGFTALDVPVTEFLGGVFDRRLRFGFPEGVAARVRVEGTVATCWGEDCRALTRVVTGIEIRAGRSACTLALSELSIGSPLLAWIRTHLPKGRAVAPLGSHYHRRLERSGIANGCIGCGRQLVGERLPRGQRELLASFDVEVTPELKAFLAALPGHAPAWGLLPQANSAFISP